MNLLVKKLWPPVLVILAAVLVISCEDPGRIGLIINANNGILKTGFRDIPLATNVVQFDPRKTSESFYVQAGKYTTSSFGTVYSKTFIQLSPDLFVQPDADSEYVKFELNIGFSDIVGPDPVNAETQGISIYQLGEPIDTTINYYRTDELTLGAKLTDWDFEPLVNDTLQTDSTYLLPLDDAIGMDLFDKMKEGSPIFDSDANFNAYFNGLGFVDKANSYNLFKIDKVRTNLTITYNEFNTDGDPIERTYSISTSSNGFYHITSDVSGTALSGITADNSDFTPSDDNLYLQFGTLMALRTDLQPFFELSDTIENMVINKAELIIGKVKAGTEYNRPPGNLHVYFTDETNDWPVIDFIGREDSSSIGSNFITLQNENQRVPPGFYGFTQDNFFNQDSLTYNIDMSFFLQNLYSGNFSSISQPFLEEKGQIFIFGRSDVLFPSQTESHSETSSLVVNQDSIRLRIHYSYPRIQQTE